MGDTHAQNMRRSVGTVHVISQSIAPWRHGFPDAVTYQAGEAAQAIIMLVRKYCTVHHIRRERLQRSDVLDTVPSSTERELFCCGRISHCYFCGCFVAIAVVTIQWVGMFFRGSSALSCCRSCVLLVRTQPNFMLRQSGRCNENNYCKRCENRIKCATNSQMALVYLTS